MKRKHAYDAERSRRDMEAIAAMMRALDGQTEDLVDEETMDVEDYPLPHLRDGAEALDALRTVARAVGDGTVAEQNPDPGEDEFNWRAEEWTADDFHGLDITYLDGNTGDGRNENYDRADVHVDGERVFYVRRRKYDHKPFDDTSAITRYVGDFLYTLDDVLDDPKTAIDAYEEGESYAG